MDVEAIGYLNAKLTAMRGLLSTATYQRMKDCLSQIAGELNSVKASNGALMAEIDTLKIENASFRENVKALTKELEAKSVIEVRKEKSSDVLTDAAMSIPVPGIAGDPMAVGIAESVPAQVIVG